MVLEKKKLNLKNPIVEVSIVYLLWLRVGIIDEYKLYNLILKIFRLKQNFLLNYILNADNIYYAFLFIVVIILTCVMIFDSSFEDMGLKSNNINKEVKSLLKFIIIFIASFTLIAQLIGGYRLKFSYIIQTIITQFCFVALVEESVFRGFICNKLFKNVKSKKTLYIMFIVSAFLFSFMHLPSFLKSGVSINFFQIINRLFNPFIMGIWFGIMYYSKKNLYICILWHGAYNLIFSFVFGKIQSICYMIFIIISIIYLMKTIEQSTVKKDEI